MGNLSHRNREVSMNALLHLINWFRGLNSQSGKYFFLLGRNVPSDLKKGITKPFEVLFQTFQALFGNLSRWEALDHQVLPVTWLGREP